MKIITTKVQCRGCQHAIVIKLEAPKRLSSSNLPFTCTACGSECLAIVKREFFREKILIKSKLIKHTQTLLNILKKRQAHAKNQRKR